MDVWNCLLFVLRKELERFCHACEAGILEDVDRYVGFGFGVNEPFKTPDGETGAMRASQFRRLEIVKFLLSVGANIHARDRSNRTISHYAARGQSQSKDAEESDDPSVLRLLAMDFKCNLWAVDNANRTPMHYAAAQGHVRIVAYLLQNAEGRQLEIKNKQNQTAYGVAVRFNQQAVANLLLRKMVRGSL